MIPTVPGIGSIAGSGFTGGAAGPSAVGDSTQGSTGGISSPVVIGGFKSDGTAAGFAVPQWVVWAGVAGGLYWLYRTLKKRG